MKLSFHGQSTIYLEGNNKKVIVDPFISNNPKCDLNIETVQVDYIVLTHGHFDHFGCGTSKENRSNSNWKCRNG